MNDGLLTIGEFSKLTGLTIKTLRFYHESGLIKPASVDASSGYRYYAADQVELAIAIKTLRELGFSIEQIGELLPVDFRPGTLVEMLEQRRVALREAMRDDRERLRRLDEILVIERQAEQRAEVAGFEVRLVEVAAQQVASMKYRGAYAECGKIFAKLARQYGRYIAGKPMILCWDSEFKDTDASFEVVFPVRPCNAKPGSQIYELSGGQAIALLHAGPYADLHRSYRKLMVSAATRGWQYETPAREVYHKGPGMIFRGDPRKYLTEIQLLRHAKRSAVPVEPPGEFVAKPE
ncbi:MerR family transcriptional regulator [Planctomycetaceae bacterium SH139]